MLRRQPVRGVRPAASEEAHDKKRKAAEEASDSERPPKGKKTRKKATCIVDEDEEEEEDEADCGERPQHTRCAGSTGTLKEAVQAVRDFQRAAEAELDTRGFSGAITEPREAEVKEVR
jgi:hypothetical protein